MRKRLTNPDFGNLLRKIREVKGLSQEELAELSQLDRTYISQLERGKKNTTLPTFLDICLALDYPADKFLGSLMPNFLPTEAIQKEIREDYGIKLPIYGTGISTGRKITPDYVVEHQLVLDDLVIKEKATTFFVHAAGDAMSPNICDGDYLVIDTSKKPKTGEVVFLKINGNFAIKRFFRSKGNITLQNDNPHYSRVYTPETSEVVICGVISSSLRLSP